MPKRAKLESQKKFRDKNRAALTNKKDVFAFDPSIGEGDHLKMYGQIHGLLSPQQPAGRGKRGGSAPGEHEMENSDELPHDSCFVEHEQSEDARFFTARTGLKSLITEHENMLPSGRDQEGCDQPHPGPREEDEE